MDPTGSLQDSCKSCGIIAWGVLDSSGWGEIHLFWPKHERKYGFQTSNIDELSLGLPLPGVMLYKEALSLLQSHTGLSYACLTLGKWLSILFKYLLFQAAHLPVQ